MDFDRELSELYPWILNIARRYCSSMQDAEDLAGETVLKILLNKDKFDCSKPMKPWCQVVMLNTYITAYNHKSLISFIGYDTIVEKVSSNFPFDSIVLKEIFIAIRKCAKRSCSMDCVLLYAKGYSYNEIGNILNLPVATVRSRIFFGRKLLLQELGLL